MEIMEKFGEMKLGHFVFSTYAHVTSADLMILGVSVIEAVLQDVKNITNNKKQHVSFPNSFGFFDH